MAQKEILLYDLPSHKGCWSLNPWKTRLMLNYKQLHYRTQWTEYPDLKKAIGPHLGDSSLDLYTSPTIRLPSGEYVMDSWKIAQRVEELYPEKPLDLFNPLTDKVQSTVAKIWSIIKVDLVHGISSELLNPASREYFRTTRTKQMGMPLDQLKAEKGGDQVYKEAAEYVNQVGDWLRENPSGPFLQGDKVCYADFIWVAFLKCLERTGEENLTRLLAVGEEPHMALYHACGQWLVRDNE